MASKLGFLVHGRAGDDLLRAYIPAAKPTVMKWLADGDPNPELVRMAKWHGAVTVLRVWWPRQEAGALGDYHAAIADACRRWPDFDAVEVCFNEWMTGSAAELREKAKIDMAGIRLAERLGKEAVVGAVSCGQPPEGTWVAYREVLEELSRTGRHYVSLHEYAAPVMQALNGSNGIGVLRSGTVTSPDGQEGWLTGRYRKSAAEWRALGLSGHLPRVIIGETGIDEVSPRLDEVPSYGWRSVPEPWASQKAGDFAAQLSWYERQLRRDPHVIGAVVYGFAAGGQERWEPFDMEKDRSMVARLQQTQAALGPVMPPPMLPTTPQKPQEAPVGYRLRTDIKAESTSPRGGYRPRYLVLHSTASGAAMGPEGTARYLGSNDRSVSAHWMVGDGVAWRLAPDSRATHHAGSATSRLPDGTTGAVNIEGVSVNLCNAVTIGVELYQVNGQPTTPGVIETGVQVAADILRANPTITVDRIVAHRDIDPSRRSDPVGVDMANFRLRVAALLKGQAAGGQQPVVGPPEGLRAAARASITLPLNAGAALFKAIRAAGFIPMGPERDLGATVVYQAAIDPAGGAEAVFWCHRGQWGQVYRTAL